MSSGFKERDDSMPDTQYVGRTKKQQEFLGAVERHGAIRLSSCEYFWTNRRPDCSARMGM